MGLFTGVLAPQIPLRDIRDGTVFLEREVGLLFSLYLPPTRLMTDEELDRISRGLALLARQVLPIGATLRFYFEALETRVEFPRSYLERLEKAPPMVREIAEAKGDVLKLLAAQGRLRQWWSYLTVTFQPLFAKGPKESYTKEEYEALLQEVEGLSKLILEGLERAGIRAERARDEEIVDFLFRYYNPSLARLGPLPKGKSILETVLQSKVENRFESRIRVGDTWIGGVAIAKGPSFTAPGLLDGLAEVPGEMIIVVEIHHPDQAALSVNLNTVRMRLESVAQDMGRRADPELVTKARLLEEALTRRAKTGEHILQGGALVLLKAKDPPTLLERVRQATGRLQTMPNAIVVPNPPNLFEYWLSSAPFSGQPLKRRWHYLDGNMAHLVPLRSPWRGSQDPIAFYVNAEGSLVGLNPFDPRSPAWNGVVVGSSGSGKTFFVQSYITSFLLLGGIVAIIDKGGGYVPLMELLGGQILYFQPGSGVRINPFDLPPGETKPDDAKKAFLLAVLTEMLSGMVKDPARAELLLMAAIDRVYLAHTTERREGNGVVRTLKTPTLSDFRRVLSTLDSAYGQPLSPEDRELVHLMVQGLARWVRGTPYGELVDGESTVDLGHPLVYFETTGISQNPDLERVGLLLLMDALWKGIGKDPATRKLLVFDEVWSLLSSPNAARFIEDLYRRLRRYGAAALSVSQRLQDFLEGNARGIVENSNYFFLLSAQNQREVLSRVFRLPEDIISRYESMPPKGEFLFLLRVEGRFEGDFLRYYPSGYEFAAFGTAPAEQVRRKEKAEALGSLPKAVRALHGEWIVAKLKEAADQAQSLGVLRPGKVEGVNRGVRSPNPDQVARPRVGKHKLIGRQPR